MAPPLRKDFPRSGGGDVTVGDKRGNLARERLRGRISHVHISFTSLLLSVLCGLWYTMVNMGYHGYIETDRM